jgi:hypothetical protein
MKPCSPLHPVNVGLLLLGAGAIGLAARRSGSGNAGAPDLSLSALRDGQAVDAERDYRANGAAFSAASGAGATQYNENVNYMGFVVWMRPSEFLRLNRPVPQTQEHRSKIRSWHDSLNKGVTLGPPILYVNLKDEVVDDRDNVLSGHFVVWEHEGRHRMKAVSEISDEPVPVHVFPGHGLRARNFRRFDFGSTLFHPDAKAASGSTRVRPSAWALDGVAHKRAGSRMMPPGFASFTAADVFDIPDEPAPPITRAVRFKDSQRGYVFEAQGRLWKVINSPPAHLEGGLPHRIIQEKDALVRSRDGNRWSEAPALYAALEGDTLVVHNVSKHGPFRPVGKVLWREDMSAPS